MEGGCQDNKLLLFKAINFEEASGSLESIVKWPSSSPSVLTIAKRENNVCQEAIWEWEGKENMKVICYLMQKKI